MTKEAWLDYRRQAEAVFSSADGVAFISNHAAQDAAHKGLRLPPERSCVINFGVDHQLHLAPTPQPPAAHLNWGDAPFLVVLGTNFRHKNRVYAIKVFHALIQQFAWPGHLIMAGPHVACGGSEEEEARARFQHPETAERIHDLDGVTEAEKAWLLANATLVLYPSLYEGFGLIPFEAAVYQTPSLAFCETAVEEVLGAEVIYLASHDPERGAETIWRMIDDREARHHQVASIQARVTIFTWDNVAHSAWIFYQQILQLAPRTGRAQMFQQAEAAEQSTENILRNWGTRLQRGVHLLRAQGWGALRKEIRQYIQWRRAQF